MILWITGLSGAGKTTLARALLPRLPQPCLLLDGDCMRDALELVATGYSLEKRRNLALTYSRLCRLVAEQNMHIVCATISLFHEVHAWNRENLPDYFEVYLKAPEDIRIERDKNKNIYDKQDVMGVHLAPEFPLRPDLILSSHEQSIEEMTNVVLNHVEKYY